MSDAKKCDRCGRFYDIYKPDDNAVGFRFIDSAEYPLRPVYDLCPDCMGELINWLTKPEEKFDVAHVACRWGLRCK